MFVSTKIFNVIACPICKGKLHYDKSAQELICNFDKLAFPIKNGIPIMIVKQANTVVQRCKKANTSHVN